MKKTIILLTLSAIFSITTSATAQITEVISGLAEPQGLAVDQVGNLYIAESAANKISVAFLNDQNPAAFDLFTSNLTTPTRLKIHNNYLYILETGSDEISRFNMLIAPPQMFSYITTGLLSPKGIDVVNGAVAVCIYGNYSIRKIDTSTLPFQMTVLTYELAKDIIVDGDLFYYANADYGYVGVNSFLNPITNSQILVSGIPHPSSLLLNEGTLFISDNIEGKLYKIDPYGSSTTPQLILTGLNNPQSMVVFNNDLYIAETGANRIVKVSLNSLLNTDFNHQFSVGLSPNPTQNSLTIKANEDIKEVSIFLSNGQKILKQNYAFDNIDVSTFPSGLYIIKVVSASNESIVSKFIKE
ncbi:MAG: T9SS type A sorting domain-containing protein [Flavobacteriales bacterium]|nr:T9SS type A sorting domain-containing protein [Flavobacteriales bacterium]